jgi:hypothetical protein
MVAPVFPELINACTQPTRCRLDPRLWNLTTSRAFRLMRFEFEPECPQGKPLPPSSHVARRSAGIESALN